MHLLNHKVGSDAPPLIVAELSGNHDGSLELALDIVDAAAAAGAHALKLQTYTRDTMTIDVADGDFYIADPDSLWTGSSLYELYGKAHTPWEWHAPIFERARAKGMLAFSAPFDPSAVDFLEDLDVPCYKIASFENTDLTLIRKAAATGKPLIISTGLATVSEIEDAVMAARGAGCQELALLKCTSAYPASPEDSNILTIPHLREMFDCEVGLSDHTLGLGAAIASVALGATMIEKHVTLDRAAAGVDSAFSLEPAELAVLVEESERAWQALGGVRYGPTPRERPSMRFRRSLYVTKDLNEGDVLDESSVRSIRPGFGLSAAMLDTVLGMRVTRTVPRGTPLSLDLLR